MNLLNPSGGNYEYSKVCTNQKVCLFKCVYDVHHEKIISGLPLCTRENGTTLRNKVTAKAVQGKCFQIISANFTPTDKTSSGRGETVILTVLSLPNS